MGIPSVATRSSSRRIRASSSTVSGAMRRQERVRAGFQAQLVEDRASVAAGDRKEVQQRVEHDVARRGARLG